MLLEVKGDRFISEVQKDFTRAYPFLKIEFFKNGSTRKERYAFEKLLSSRLRMKDAWFLNKHEGYLEFGDETTVLELENEFIRQFGLSAQLFRKSGNLWLETTFTDNLSLKQQNDHGREISTGNHRREAPDDYDLTRQE